MIPITQYEPPEPFASIELATVSLVTASQLLGDALKVDMHPLTREQLTDVLDIVDNAIDALRNLGI